MWLYYFVGVFLILCYGNDMVHIISCTDLNILYTIILTFNTHTPIYYIKFRKRKPSDEESEEDDPMSEDEQSEQSQESEESESESESEDEGEKILFVFVGQLWMDCLLIVILGIIVWCVCVKE